MDGRQQGASRREADIRVHLWHRLRREHSVFPPNSPAPRFFWGRFPRGALAPTGSGASKPSLPVLSGYPPCLEPNPQTVLDPFDRPNIAKLVEAGKIVSRSGVLHFLESAYDVFGQETFNFIPYRFSPVLGTNEIQKNDKYTSIWIGCEQLRNLQQSIGRCDLRHEQDITRNKTSGLTSANLALSINE